MKVLDFFSGVGGFSLGLTRSGHEVVGACEIDPDARRVYEARLGHGVAWEDVRGIGRTLPAADLWTAGFPCQDLSSAGKRAGWRGDRSVLVFDLLRAAADARPEWLLLENVPGLLHVRGGRDFGVLLCALEDVGYVGAWRVLDARHFGVPQRRRRVFVLARRAGAGADPAEVLADRAGGARGPGARGAEREAVAGTIESRAGGRLSGDDAGLLIPFSVYPEAGQGADLRAARCDVSPAVIATESERGVRIVAAFDPAQVTHPENRARCGPDTSPSLCATAGAPAVALTLTASNAKGPSNGNLNLMSAGVGVRRLTPTECERLQGFPDGWTDGLGLADTTRYRLLGNSVAVPVVEWIGRRLAELERSS